jgi:hypothetical protein
MNAQQLTYKLNDEQFWSALRENGGLFARTARYIQKRYGIPFSRQAVSKRANTRPGELEDIIEESLDVAEEALQELIRTAQPTTRLEAIRFFLKTHGASRGYGDRQTQIKATVDAKQPVNDEQEESAFSLIITVVGNE